jgi:mannan endo-1,4-beta-mannosidase
MSFVQAKGTEFRLDDRPFFFAGTNIYYLPYQSGSMTGTALDAAQALGFPVVRTWGFSDVGALDGAAPDVYFQFWDPLSGAPAYNDGPTGLERLDSAINAARQRGLRLILPLVNNWRDFGGVDQYVSWYALDSHRDFFIDLRARRAYMNWVEHIVTRTNALNGLQYKNDDTIMAWELGNELRCPGDSAALIDWVGEMSAFLKGVDPDHLIGVGDEGFFRRPGNSDWAYDGSQGSDFEAFLEISSVDFGSFHMYPESWGKTNDFAESWIKDHLDCCARANKPALLEEFGLRDASSRNAVYAGWLSQFNDRRGAGDLFWMLAAEQDDGTLYPDFDGFTLYRNSIPEAIVSHVAEMRARNGA